MKLVFQIHGQPKVELDVPTFEIASGIVRSELAVSGVGNSGWSGAKLYDDDGKLIGHVSYNGRVWAGPARAWSTNTRLLWPEKVRCEGCGLFRSTDEMKVVTDHDHFPGGAKLCFGCRR